jgi:hypothetical protein
VISTLFTCSKWIVVVDGHYCLVVTKCNLSRVFYIYCYDFINLLLNNTLLIDEMRSNHHTDVCNLLWRVKILSNSLVIIETLSKSKLLSYWKTSDCSAACDIIAIARVAHTIWIKDCDSNLGGHLSITSY